MRLGRLTTLVAWAAAAAPGQPDALPLTQRHWFEARTAYFHIYSCGPTQEVARLAARLEQFRDAYSTAGRGASGRFAADRRHGLSRPRRDAAVPAALPGQARQPDGVLQPRQRPEPHCACPVRPRRRFAQDHLSRIHPPAAAAQPALLADVAHRGHGRDLCHLRGARRLSRPHRQPD